MLAPDSKGVPVVGAVAPLFVDKKVLASKNGVTDPPACRLVTPEANDFFALLIRCAPERALGGNDWDAP